MVDMDRALILQARIVRAQIIVAAMQAANSERERRGEAQAYPDSEFMDVIRAEAIDEQSVREMVGW